MYLKSSLYLFILCFTFIFQSTWMNAQEFDVPADSLVVPSDTIPADSLVVPSDTIPVDTLADKGSFIDAKVSYTATDSMRYSLSGKRIYLYGDAQINYLDIELKSAKIEFDMSNEEVSAFGMLDSLGKEIGKPQFKEGSEEFQAHVLRYNFNTKKGHILKIMTEQEGGYLHAEQTKRHASGHVHLRRGKYTTCDAEHPHFYLALTKGKVIPNDKIVSGPAYLVLEDVPLPIGVPFGFFPNTRNSKSGILIPSYGEEINRGFFLRNAGYYYAGNDYFDARITGDIYSQGTWGANLASTYRKRYKFSGMVNTRFYQNVSGERGFDFAKKNDFAITWSHNQDRKANPYQNFGANVNYSSQTFDRNHNYNNPQAFLTNTKSSSVSYSRSWPNQPFNLSANLRHSQNSRDTTVNFTLPAVTFNVNRIYPFRPKESSGKAKWYENLEFSYSSSLENKIDAKEYDLFTKNTLDNMKSGFRHSVPFGTNIKILRHFNLSPRINYTGVINTRSIRKSYDHNFYDAELDSTYGAVRIDTIRGITYAQGYAPSISLSTNPPIYGMYTFKKGKITAIRHVLTPSASISLVPDMKGLVPEYYRTYLDQNNKEIEYSIYEGSIYGTPTLPGKSGTVSLGLRNNVEMKIKTPKDTTQSTKKIPVIENLSFNTGYNIFADSMNWSNVNITGGTSFFNRMVDIQVRATVDPYSLNENFRRINQFEYKNSGKIGRLTNAGLSLSTSYTGGQGEPKETTEDTQGLDGFDYFNIPWSVSLNYNFDYNKSGKEANIMQTVGVSGDLSLTPKWKIGYSTGYDFKMKEFTHTGININRDLHCWMLRVDFSPFGSYKYYNFQINVKSAILQDLKYQKRKPWQDFQ